MAKSRIIYSEVVNLIADFYHPKSDEWVEYQGNIKIKESGKQPINIEIKFIDGYVSFAPEPPSQHTIKAKNLIDLNLKLIRWFNKYSYILKETKLVTRENV